MKLFLCRNNKREYYQNILVQRTPFKLGTIGYPGYPSSTAGFIRFAAQDSKSFSFAKIWVPRLKIEQNTGMLVEVMETPFKGAIAIEIGGCTLGVRDVLGTMADRLKKKHVCPSGRMYRIAYIKVLRHQKAPKGMLLAW